MAFAIGGILWLLRKRVRIPGMLFFIYLLLNSIERFWIEKIRVNPDIFSAFGLKFTQAEIIAIVLFLIQFNWHASPLAKKASSLGYSRLETTIKSKALSPHK